jgi:hypothetical protein
VWSIRNGPIRPSARTTGLAAAPAIAVAMQAMRRTAVRDTTLSM